MAENTVIEEFTLTSGATSRLLRIRNDIIPNYYLLCFPKELGEPASEEVTEMLNIGVSYAQKIALEQLSDKEAFSILYSGYSARREKGWHVHIVLLGNRWRKAWLYFVLGMKNLLQAFGLRKDDSPRFKNDI